LSCRRQNQPALGTEVCPFTLIGERPIKEISY